jgi:hypothetical protein
MKNEIALLRTLSAPHPPSLLEPFLQKEREGRRL